MVRNILLIVIDCLRADHVSCYGYPRQTTPNIDRLAAEGHLWEQANSVCCWTRPSVASIFTGLYPTQHGAFEYIKRSGGASGTTTDALRTSQPTLAETLASHGWRSGAFARNEQLGEYTKLNRGFDRYVPDAGKSRELIEKYRGWVEESLGVPSFAYLHLMEAHWPYRARERHLSLFGGNLDNNCFRNCTGVEYGELKRALSVGEASIPPFQLEQMVQMYDACVLRADEQVGLILETLEALGIGDETAVIVTADHGEEFLEHGGLGHGQGLFEELIHVPMVMRIPGRDGPIRYPHPVSQVDLASTVLELAGISDHKDTKGRDFFASAHGDRPLFSERRKRKRYSQTIRHGQWKFHRRYKFKIPNEEFDPCMATQDMLAIYRHKVVRELYDIQNDPNEQEDLSGDPQFVDVRERLEGQLDDWWNRVNASRQEDQVESDGVADVEMDPRVLERLRDLGYLE